MRFKLLLLMSVVCSAGLSSPARSLAEVRQGRDVSIAADQVVDDDLYVFAQTATVNGTIKGDLIIFAQQFNLNGSVEGDLVVAAQQIAINGKVADDSRISGQIITLQNLADIGDDLIAAGFRIEAVEDSHIGGEVKFAGYESILAGQVEKDVQLSSANSLISGKFGGNVEAVVEGSPYPGIGGWGANADLKQVPTGLTVSDTADITGSLKYWSTREAKIDPQATIEGDVEFAQTNTMDDQAPTLMGRAVSFAKQFLALLVVGMLVVYWCPNWTNQVVDNVQRRPLASLIWGVLALIGGIAGGIVLLVAIIAIAILLGFVFLENLISAWLWLGLLSTGLLAVSFWLYSTWIAKVIVSVWAGNKITRVHESAGSRYFAVATGVFAYLALSWIPIAGTAISLVVTLLGLGSTFIWCRRKSSLPVEKQLA